MKSLRRSLNAKDSGGPPISPPVSLPSVHKPPSAIQPPKKVIRALQPYRPQAPQELGFAKGDFFYVMSEVPEGQGWYEAHNPVSGARGLVPKACFEEFHKANAVSRAVSPASSTMPPPSPFRFADPRSPSVTPSSSRHRTFYAVVLHDFQAERADELEAKNGDPITVVAQSNEEWFVAKPIGKLGRPGLIPASFVELRDPATNLPLPDVAGIIARGELPKVEDWKRAMHEYKQSSIPLGVIDDRSVPQRPRTNQHLSSPPQPQPTNVVQAAPTVTGRSKVPMEPLPQERPPTPLSLQDPSILPPGVLISAEVVDFHFENDEYWFRINAIYQPDDQSIDARQLLLFRVYDDFYDFQIALLDAFPVEAGRETGYSSPQSEDEPLEPGSTRILPYMPGPVPQVDDVVTALRREELDDYLGQLCTLRDINAEHILGHHLVRSFFSPKPGDVETPISAAPVAEGRKTSPVQYKEARDGLGALSLGSGRGYPDDSAGYGAEKMSSRPSDYSYAPDERVPSRNGSYAHLRMDSTASLSLSRNASPPPGQSPPTSNRLGYDRADSGRSNSHAANPLGSPPISATNSQAAFVKIKIFHRRTDDLIAIRVNPRVSHMQLMEKVRERLGDDVQTVSYRNSLTGTFADLRDDYAVRDWVNNADKHVLYAS